MTESDYNNDFFGWFGIISRKNYAINMFIVLALFAALSFVNFNAFEPFIPFKFLLTALIFTADLLKLVLSMCALSLVYRRIADFAAFKPYKLQSALRKLFIILYVIPALYILCARYFLSFMPAFINITDMLIFFILMPAAFLCALVFCFIKRPRRNRQ